MRSTTVSTVRRASSIAAIVLAGGSLIQVAPAFADNNGQGNGKVAATAPATAGPGKSHDNVPGKECEHGVHTHNPHCTPAGSQADPVEAPSPIATAEPTKPATAEPTAPATSEPTKQPSAEPTKPATAEPTAPATSEPTQAATPVEKPKGDAGQVTTEVWWLLEPGTTAELASQTTQTRIPAGEVPCGRMAQVDIYKGTQAELDALGDTLVPGEDAQVYVSSRFVTGEPCATETPAPVVTETPAPSEQPSTPATPEAPAPSTEPAPSKVPAPDETAIPMPVVTPAPTEPATPQPSDAPTTEATPGAPTDGQTPPVIPLPVEAPSTPATPVVVVVPTAPATTVPVKVNVTVVDKGEKQAVVLPLPATTGHQAPASLPLPATQGQRPTALPHTGDQSDGLGLGLGAGLAGIVFAASFVGRRKH